MSPICRKNDSAIVIKVGIPNKKHFYVYGIYCQWSLLNDKESIKIKNQEERWKKTVKSMKKVLDKGEETFIIGDINVNTMAFYKNENQKTQYEKKLSNMYDEFINLIKNYNLVTQNKNIPTRNNSILDIIYTNKPEKIINYKIGINNEGSDHLPVTITRTIKKIIDIQYYKMYRDYKNYNSEQIHYNIIMDERHVKILESENVDEATDMFISMLNDSMKIIAPIKKRIKKPKNKQYNLSKEAKEFINTVDIQKILVKNDPNEINKKILNELNKELIKMKDIDRFKSKSNILRNQKSEIGLWKTMSNNFKEKNDIPTLLLYNNEVSLGPNKMAEVFNQAFLNKTKNIKDKIDKGEDPMIFYTKKYKKCDNIF